MSSINWNSLISPHQEQVTKGEYGPATQPLDIFFAYRLLLGRHPEVADSDAWKTRTAEFPSVHDLLAGFMASHEFRNRYYGHLPTGHRRIVHVPIGRRRVAVDLDDLVIGWRIINGTYEPEITALIRLLVKPGMTCIDLGANIGYMATLLADLVGESGRVVAYEPLPGNYKLLCDSVRESNMPWVDPRQKARADARGVATLAYSEQVYNSGGAFLGSGDGFTTVEVQVVSIDDDIRDWPKIDFIKMDIEGAEPRAVAGMRHRLANDRPPMITEINPTALQRGGNSVDAYVGLFRELEYTFLGIAEVPGELPVQLHRLASAADAARFENVLAVPEEQVDAILHGLPHSVVAN